MNLEMVKEMIKLYKVVYGATKPFMPTVLISKNSVAIHSGNSHVFIEYPGCIDGIEDGKAIVLSKDTLDKMANSKKDIVFTPQGWVSGAISHNVEWEYCTGELEEDYLHDIDLMGTYSLDASDFKLGLQSVKYAVGKDDSRPVLKNIALDSGTLVGVDGYRIHTYKLNSDDCPDNLCMLTGAVYGILEKIITKRNNTLECAIGNEGQAYFRYGNIHLYCYDDREYMTGYKECFKGAQLSIKVFPEELYNIVEQIMNEKDEDKDKNKSGVPNNLVLLSTPIGYKVDILKVEMHMVNCKNNVKIEDSIPIEIVDDSGIRDKLNIAFNPKYICQALKPIKDMDEATISFNTNLAPAIVEAGQVKNLILPIRIRN